MYCFLLVATPPMCGGDQAINSHLASVNSTKARVGTEHTPLAEEMSTVIDAETTVTPNTTNMPALIAADNEIVWFPWHFMIRRQNLNLPMEIVD